MVYLFRKKLLLTRISHEQCVNSSSYISFLDIEQRHIAFQVPHNVHEKSRLTEQAPYTIQLARKSQVGKARFPASLEKKIPSLKKMVANTYAPRFRKRRTATTAQRQPAPKR